MIKKEGIAALGKRRRQSEGNGMIAKKWWFIACFTTIVAWNLSGQAESGSVVGVVTDQGGAVVPGASVTILNEGTRLTRSVTTNENGQYFVYSFPTGASA